MVKSMTGFGRAEANQGTYKILVEMKSVNHRFCEINIRMPKQFLVLEEKLKKAVGSYLHRGRVEVFITIEGQNIHEHSLDVDWKLLSAYIDALHKAKDRHQISGSIEINDILKLENVFTIKEAHTGMEEIEKSLLEQVQLATEQLVSMRTLEGEQLKEDIFIHLTYIENMAQELQQFAPLVVEAYRKRIEKKMKEFLGSEIVEQRIMAEAAIFADRADINEELKRIHSHLGQFTQSLHSTDPVGRKLDFLVQELNREVNTIGSKANDAKIANLVVEMKACLEKIKEQVQNIE
ncbi:YicC/YloC family endoribonuclease [Sutcliffiella horikoshii]|uniref:YicC/YloC family endoribonuclease n=1 Tax=Sutcliffiella horikoshii TaxID=79883 RepID=UPI001F3197E8|nr:YicC/YloC family endoribonuclease [Sutcliffiella horikoshii]MCG1020591.1 YicC family protein [Sutcliffiella horikoshii]